MNPMAVGNELMVILGIVMFRKPLALPVNNHYHMTTGFGFHAGTFATISLVIPRASWKGKVWVSAMLSRPQGCFGSRGLETLVELYIPRNPLQDHISSQANVQYLTASKVSIEYYLHLLLRESREAFEHGQREKAEKLTDKAVRLAAQEIARAYRRHLLLKLQAYWSRVVAVPGGGRLQPLRRMQRALEESVTYVRRIVNAQII